jgi:streptomycin 6-kinase
LIHDRIQSLARQWDVVLNEPIRQSPTGQVAFGRRANDQVVVKVPNPDEDEANSLAVLLHFRGSGAVKVLDHDGSAMLLERPVPGRPLTELVIAGRDDEATAILCDVIAALHRFERPQQSFPAVEDWGRELDDYRHSGDTDIPADLVDRAIGLFAELAGSQGPRRLLHGDLHHHNILSDQRRDWLAIDPKGVIGESSYEVGAALRNPTPDFVVPSIIERRVGIICERLGFDRKRVLGWAFAQSVLSTVWLGDASRDPTPGLTTAEAMLQLL